MRGIVLAGGAGTRLWPLTATTSKQLLPVYDKPLIYYPLATLMAAGIRELLVITTPTDQAGFINLLGDGSRFGVSISYAVQPEPKGLAQALIIGESFINRNSVALILGDNIFHGHGLGRQLATFQEISGAHIFAHQVSDPERYGVVEFDNKGRAISIVEKPKAPRSSWAVPGLYFYDASASDVARGLRPSLRGELEITDVNRHYMKAGSLHVTPLSRGTAWFDTGTFDSLQDAGTYIRIIQERQGRQVACLEEISWRNGWLSNEEFENLIQLHGKSSLGKYLKYTLNDDR